MPSITVKPTDGGQLITRASSSEVGLQNYTVKRSIRRDLTDEIRREGWDYFIPFPDDPDDEIQPFPSTDAINLIHLIHRPNGEIALIAGTKTTLYRLNLSLSGYFVDGYIEPGYFEDGTIRWQIIGSGFSSQGRRWEVIENDGIAMFNNAVDLPVIFRVEWRYVQPAYELRDQGIVSIGTIALYNSLGLLGDVTELTPEGITAILGIVRSGAITVHQDGFRASGEITASTSGNVITSSAPFFEGNDEGRIIVWSDNRRMTITGFIDSQTVSVDDVITPAIGGRHFRITSNENFPDRPSFFLYSSADFFTPAMVGKKVGWASGVSRTITEYYSPTIVSVDNDRPIPEGEVFMDNPLAYVAATAIPAKYKQRRQFRLLISELGAIDRYGAVLPVASISGNKLLLTKRTQMSLSLRDEVAVDGAGSDGGVLVEDEDGNTVKVEAMGPGFVRLSTRALTTDDAANLSHLSVIGNTAGFSDLQAAGGAILKGATLDQRIIIYKDDAIFVGRYTGLAEAPLDFVQLDVPHGRFLYYRNTLSNLDERVHVFAGKTQFYSFDLTTRTPQPIPAADLVGNLFFDFAAIEDTEEIYSADNHLTQELWIVCPKNTTDPVLAYDYVYKTFSTVDFAPTAANTIHETSLAGVAGRPGDIFLMGTGDGVILIYGLTSQPISTWIDPYTHIGPVKFIMSRRSARLWTNNRDGYTSLIGGGLAHFGDAFNEKHLSTYVPQFSSRQPKSGNCKVYLYRAHSQQKETERLIGSMTVNHTAEHGTVPVHATDYFFRDEIRITGKDNPTRLHLRTWEIEPHRSKAFHRRP